MGESERFWDRAAKSSEGKVNDGDEAAITIIDHTRKYLQPSDIVPDYACATGKYAFEITLKVPEESNNANQASFLKLWC